jgi:hypothetical protein
MPKVSKKALRKLKTRFTRLDKCSHKRILRNNILRSEVWRHTSGEHRRRGFSLTIGSKSTG